MDPPSERDALRLLALFDGELPRSAPESGMRKLKDSAAVLRVVRNCGYAPRERDAAEVEQVVAAEGGCSLGVLRGLVARFPNDRVADEQRIVRLLGAYDTEESGTVPLRTLRALLTQCGDRLTENEFDFFIRDYAQAFREGRVDYRLLAALLTVV